MSFPTDKGLKPMERGNLPCLHPAVTQKHKTYKVGVVSDLLIPWWQLPRTCKQTTELGPAESLTFVDYSVSLDEDIYIWVS